MTATPYLRQKLLEHATNDPAWTVPTTFYVGLLVTGVEVTGGSYARQPITNADIGAAAGTDPVEKQVTSVVTYPEATASWGTPNEWGIYDASTAGNLLWTEAITTPKPIAIGDTARIPANTIKLRTGDLA